MTESGTSTTSEEGSTTLVTLPEQVDLPKSGLLNGISQNQSLFELNLLTVLYDTTPNDWIQTIAATNGHPANLGIVSINDTSRSTADQSPPARENRPQSDTEENRLDIVTPVPDPTELHDFGIAITRYLNTWEDSDADTVVLFDSVTDLLEGVDRTHAFQFIHILSNQIDSKNGTGFFIVHPTRHEPETMSMLREFVDDVIEYVGFEGEITGDLMDDPLMDILNGPRRLVMDQLLRDEALTIADLAAKIAESGIDDDRIAVEIALVHSHLPKLANQGLVNYDPESEIVELATPVERVRPYLRLARERDEE